MNQLLAVLCGVAVGFLIYVFYFKGKGTLERIKVEKLTAENVIGWFKEPENVELIRSNSNSICVLLKDREAVKYAKIQVQAPNKACVQAIFDKVQNKIKKARVIEYREIDDILARQFGEKDMVIFT